MAYSKQNFKDGNVLNAEQLNNIENGIQIVQDSIPTTLKNPEALKFTGAVIGSYDGSVEKTFEIPQVPQSLKNPNALTINIGSESVVYDGSVAKSISIEDGTEVSY